MHMHANNKIITIMNMHTNNKIITIIMNMSTKYMGEQNSDSIRMCSLGQYVHA